MGKPLNYKKADVLKAIKGSGSIVSAVAKRLNCTWGTAKTYIESWPETIEAMKDESETILDLCESTLYKSVQNGDTQSAKWLLATKGKYRGFSDKQEIEISGPNGGPINIDAPARLSLEEWEKLHGGK